MAPKTFGRFVLKTIGVLAFCAVSGYALFYAYGYNLDLQNRHIEKTSIIDVPSRYPEVRVYMDDKLIGNSLPLQIKDLLPGFYTLAVNKLGYLPWSRKLQVQTDIVTKVEDLVLVPEHADGQIQQLAHFPDQSRYFFSKDFFIVLTPKQDYLTLVYLLDQGTMKEDELKLARQDIQDIQIYTAQNFLITFNDGSHEWVQFNGPRFVDFVLPNGSSGLAFLPSQNEAFFLNNGDLYRLQIDQFSGLTAKILPNFLLTKNVDQFDVHDGKLVYISNGLAYSADDQGKNIRLLDRSHTLSYIRFVPLQNGAGGLYVLRNLDNKRSLYFTDESGGSTLLTPQLKGNLSQDSSGRVLFTDESGNIFVYKPLLKKKMLVTTLPTDFTLMGQLFDDGHFIIGRQGQVFMADSTFTNVYPLFGFQQTARYFLHNGAVFSLDSQKLKSLFLLPKN